MDSWLLLILALCDRQRPSVLQPVPIRPEGTHRPDFRSRAGYGGEISDAVNLRRHRDIRSDDRMF